MEKRSSWIDKMYHIGNPCISMYGTGFNVPNYI